MQYEKGKLYGKIVDDTSVIGFAEKALDILTSDNTTAKSLIEAQKWLHSAVKRIDERVRLATDTSEEEWADIIEAEKIESKWWKIDTEIWKLRMRLNETPDDKLIEEEIKDLEWKQQNLKWKATTLRIGTTQPPRMYGLDRKIDREAESYL